MFLVKTPALIRALMPAFEWRLPSKEKILYLTFDDGPIPVLTPWVLDVLQQYGAKATFFCVGHNVQKHPDIYARILAEGHSTGNHTFNHLNGWKTDTTTYLDNVQKCAEWVDSPLFRPPYGRITRTQRRSLSQQYRLIMWDVLSGDFSANISPEQCRDGVIRHARSGSIIVFHDNIKATKNLHFALPAVLEHFLDKGFTFDAINTPFKPRQNT